MASGVKKGTVALHVALVDLDLPVALANGIDLLGEPGPLSEFWTKGLGEWKVESYRECNVIVEASTPSNEIGVLDAEHSRLSDMAWEFLGALTVCGLHLLSQPIGLKRSQSEEEDSLRMYSESPTWVETGGLPDTVLNRDMVDRALAVYSGLRRISQSREQFQRLRKGYRSILAGMLNHSCDDRGYYFARALESLHATKRGDGKPAFIAKCSALCGTSGNDQLFDDLYEIRNNVVHVNPFDDLARPGENLLATEARVVSNCASAEIIAKEVFQLVLSDPALLEGFVDDASIRSLWASGFALSANVWPQQIRARREETLEEWEVRTYV